MTLNQIKSSLQEEMKNLNYDELKIFAERMGVCTRGLDRSEIEDECLALEEYTYTH